MNLKQLNAKKVRVAAKNGATVEALCVKYRCSADELRVRIGFLYGKDEKAVAKIWSQLEQNEKLPQYSRAADRAAQPENAEVAAQADVDGGADAAYESREIGLALEDDDMSSVYVVETADDPCAELREKEERLSAEVMALERDHKKAAGRHRDYIAQLRELKTAIDKIGEALQAKYNKYTELAGLCNATVEQMNELSATRREKLAELCAVRDKLAELNRVVLLVDADGGVVAMDNPEFDYDESGSDELYRELLDDSRCEGLRVRDVRTLARLLQIAENAGAPVEVACEVAEIEEVFYMMAK